MYFFFFFYFLHCVIVFASFFKLCTSCTILIIIIILLSLVGMGKLTIIHTSNTVFRNLPSLYRYVVPKFKPMCCRAVICRENHWRRYSKNIMGAKVRTPLIFSLLFLPISIPFFGDLQSTGCADFYLKWTKKCSAAGLRPDPLGSLSAPHKTP